jgi:hypothetical protein
VCVCVRVRARAKHCSKYTYIVKYCNCIVKYCNCKSFIVYCTYSKYTFISYREREGGRSEGTHSTHTLQKEGETGGLHHGTVAKALPRLSDD